MHTQLTSPTRVRQILVQRGFQPSKTLGQNFLIDANILGIVLAAADLQNSDRVLEIGPGLGVVTGPLLERVEHVVAVEKDPRLYDVLTARFGNEARITLRCGDALRMLSEGAAGAKCNKMVSNLPYNVASRILVTLAGDEQGPERMVVTVQEEVARRLTARPSDPDYGLLTVRVNVRYAAAIVKKVSPTCFWPRPRVESMIVVLNRISRSISPDVERRFERITRCAFAHRRKQMRGILARQWTEMDLSVEDAEVLLAASGIEPAARPEAIDVTHWLALADALHGAKHG